MHQLQRCWKIQQSNLRLFNEITINAVFIGYVTYYATDMLGLSAGLIGMLLLVSKIFDGVTDLVIGFIIDKTHTKLGKARPYEIFIVLAWFFTIIMFSVPDGLSTVGKAALVFVMYVLINAVCMTCLGGEDAVYMARAIRSPKNRISVMSISGAIGMIIVVVFSIVFPQLMATIGSTKAGWSKLAIMLGVPLAIIGLGRMIFIKEVVSDEDEKNTVTENTSQEKVGFKTMLSAVSKNKYIFILAGLYFLTFIITGLNTTSTTYYFKYIVGDIGLQSIASLGALFTPVVLIVFPALTQKFGTTNIMRGSAIFGIIGIAIRTIGGTNMTTILIGGTIASFSSLPLTSLINTYLIDCMDYGEYKTGVRVEGMLNSITNFMGKLGNALASGLTGLIMGLSGYNGEALVQSDSANAAIIGMYNYMPMILFALILLLSIAYTIDKHMPDVRKALEANNA